MKVDAEPSGCNNFLQDIKLMKNVVKIVIDAWWYCTLFSPVFSSNIHSLF